MRINWEENYRGKINTVDVKFPERDFVALKSVHGFKLANYRFHHDNPKGLVFAFHGMHMSSYDWTHLAKSLYEEGFTVAAMDQEGHGNSEGERGTINSLEEYERSCVKFIRKTRKLYNQGTPVFCIGLSMGGALSVMAVLNKPEWIKGIILLGASLGVDPNFEPSLQKIVRCLNACCCSKLRLKPIDQTLASRNKDYPLYFNDNPEFFHGKVNVKTGCAILNGYSRVEARLNEVRCSVLVFHGEQDKLANIETIKLFMSRSESADKSIFIYRDMYHVITHEPEYPEILSKIIEWLNSRV